LRDRRLLSNGYEEFIDETRLADARGAEDRKEVAGLFIDRAPVGLVEKHTVV
jgi:hypothetical protein